MQSFSVEDDRIAQGRRKRSFLASLKLLLECQPRFGHVCDLVNVLFSRQRGGRSSSSEEFHVQECLSEYHVFPYPTALSLWANHTSTHDVELF
jgi:hypothetical protein